MENYWFTLYPETFLWIKGEEGFIYNTKEFSMFHFLFDPCTRIKEICEELLVIDNLYATSLTKADIETSKVKDWINSIIDIQAGGFISGLEKRPVSFKPTLKLMNDIGYCKWEHDRGTGGCIMQNLHELTFYLNKSDWGNNDYFKQTIFPLQDCDTLELGKVASFIHNSKNIFLSNVNIVGNIFSYPGYKNLFIDDISITIHLTIQDFANNLKTVNETEWPDHIRFNILLDPKYNLPLMDLQSFQIPISITALVTTEDECSMFSDIFEDRPIYKDARIIPLYDGKNIDFFKSNVFTEREEFDSIALTKREIFMRQVLNIHHFGKLTILPDGKVYTNVNDTPLGTIDDSPYSIVYKEFTEGRSWFRIRDHSPCNDCVYQWLCPSPSNYETVIGRPNLCHVKQ